MRNRSQDLDEGGGASEILEGKDRSWVEGYSGWIKIYHVTWPGAMNWPVRYVSLLAWIVRDMRRVSDCYGRVMDVSWSGCSGVQLGCAMGNGVSDFPCRSVTTTLSLESSQGGICRVYIKT